MLGWIRGYRMIIDRVPGMNPLNALWGEEGKEKKMRVD